MKLVLVAVSVFGHLAIATVIINRLHASALPHWCLKLLDAIWLLWHFLVPFAWVMWVFQPTILSDMPFWAKLLLMGHFGVCWAVAIALVPGWVHRRITRQTSPLQLSNHTGVVDMVEAVGHRPTNGTLVRLLSRVPRNEIFQLHVCRKELVIPRLHPALEGLTITHLSDLHFTGEIAESFHREVVRQANRLKSDVIALTGDLIDKRRCMCWLGDVLGRLEAAHGVYFVLGNHDLRLHDEFGVRDALTSAGLVDLGKRWTQIEVRGVPIVLAGNELPWFTPAADLRDCPPANRADSPLRILLSHAPDQLPWAKVNDIDLLLAGHTHGGQIQLPILGPLLSPSRFGVKYASGTFYECPTLMHVSRGISGTRHIRIKAPPELTQLVLVRDVTERLSTHHLAAAQPECLPPEHLQCVELRH